MTDIQHIDVDTDEYLDTPKALRDHVKKLQEALTKSGQEYQALTTKVSATALTGVLEGFKNPERVKRDLLSDKIDPLDSEAVGKWLVSNGDDYARGEGTPPPENSSSVDPEEQAAHQKIANTASLGNPANMSKLDLAVAEITPDMDGKAIEAIYRKHGL